VVNRRKQIADRAQGDGQAKSLSNLQITARHLDPDYEFLSHDLTRGETGLLRVFSLIPKIAGKPSFDARVDDGSPGKRRELELDIDIKGVTATTERDFKANRNGYVGHHTNRSPNPNRRIFDVEIAVPAGRLFEGEVAFNVTFSVSASLSMASTVTADATVVKATRIRRLRNWLTELSQKLFH
jgi:hypothetical protein